MIIASIEEDGWELLDAVEQSRQSDSFEIPSIEDRMTLTPGMVVKLFFCLLRLSATKPTIELEGMWVQITERHNCIYKGILLDEPGVRCALKEGHELYFTPDHICSMMVSWDDPRNPDRLDYPP